MFIEEIEEFKLQGKTIYQPLTSAMIQSIQAKFSINCPQCNSNQIKTVKVSHKSHMNKICLNCTQRFNKPTVK